MDLGRSINNGLISTIDLAIKFDLAMEMPNLSIERKFILTSQVEGAQNSTPPTNNIEGPNRSINNNTQTFW